MRERKWNCTAFGYIALCCVVLCVLCVVCGVAWWYCCCRRQSTTHIAPSFGLGRPLWWKQHTLPTPPIQRKTKKSIGSGRCKTEFQFQHKIFISSSVAHPFQMYIQFFSRFIFYHSLSTSLSLACYEKQTMNLLYVQSKCVAVR